MMAEYSSGLFYSRSISCQNLSSISQLNLLSLPPELDFGPLYKTSFKEDAEIAKDIILLAEFSEIEGPVPLISIPQNVQDLNLNDFVVQLMSTDFHNVGRSDFHVYSDTSLLQEDSDKGLYTYVHYFTLYDVRARGFVRPMCLAYISREPEKLTKYFKHIQKEFNKATKYLRISNLNLFAEEMKLRIKDLHFTKERFIQSHHLSHNENVDPLTRLENLKEGKRKRTSSLSNEMFTSPRSTHAPKPISLNNRSPLYIKGNILKQKTCLSPGKTVERNKYLSYTELTSSHHLCDKMLSSMNGEFRLSSSLPLHETFHHSNELAMHKLSPPADNLILTHSKSRYKPCLNPYSSVHCESTTTRESAKEFVFDGLSHSSDSSSSTIKSSKDAKSPRYGVQASSLMHDNSMYQELNRNEELSVLQHTSLDALAVQLLDCQYILEVVKKYLEESETTLEIEKFVNDVNSKPQSPLYNAMKELELLKPIFDAKKEPSIFVISLMRRNFRNMRSIRSLCGIGYIACMTQLLDVYKKFSKPTLTLLFEALDHELHMDPFSSLFIGNIPIVHLGSEQREHSPKVPIRGKFSLSDNCWNEDLIRLLYVDLSKATTPDSEYADAKETLDLEVTVADDCLEVFTSQSIASNEKTLILANSQMNEDCSDSYLDEFRSSVKSSNVLIKDTREHSTPIRSTSSDSSWASSTPRDINFIEGMENDFELDGEEEVAVSNVSDKHIKITPYNIDRRMMIGKLYHMSALIQQFSGVSQCIVHSVLSGKPMVIAGPEYLKAVVVLYTKTLSTILPIKPTEFIPVLKWHTGTIIPFHLNMYKIIGACIPERLHVQDLMSSATLNQVTVLNIETGHISGVAYSGSLLHKADQLSRRHFRSDLSLQSVLQSILVTLGMKVFLHFHLCRTTPRTSNEILKAIGVPRGDWHMVQYLSKMLKEQISQTL